MRKLFRGNDKVQFYLGDVRDLSSVKNAVSGVDVIFHAATLKQVSSCELFPMEAVKTNIIGTDNVLTAAIEEGVKKVVCLSSDKGVYPVNAMGASKEMMEKVFIARSRTTQNSLICGTRSGNLICRHNAVIPLFIEQIKAGEQVTVTDPSMTRFLMSLDEALDLAIFACDCGSSGDIIVPKASAVRVGDLAQALIEIFGAKCPVKTIGALRGEKFHETLLAKEELARAKDMGRFFIVPAGTKDLNYEQYFTKGDACLAVAADYSSSTAPRLNLEELKLKLLAQDFIAKAAAEFKGRK